jgi:hypothetical protein
MSTAQTFKLTSPTGEVIMTGSLDALMERLPDTHARNDALESMLKIACDAVEAEEKLEDARACATKILHDGITRLSARMDAFEKRRAISMKRAHAEAQRSDQQRVQAMLDALPDPDDPEPHSFDRKEREATPADQDPEGIIPAPEDPTGASIDPDDVGLEGVTATRPVTDPLDLAHPPAPNTKQVPQPVSISLNAED